MKHNNLYQIIEEEFDNRLRLTVIETLLGYVLAKIRENPLESQADEGTISYRLTKCINRIANECTEKEILEYVVEEWGWSLERR